MLRLLVMSTLYPNKQQPQHGIFVETRLRQLLASGKVSAEVIAPVPWFPAGLSRWPGLSGLKRHEHYAKIPVQEVRHGIEIHHPRYLLIPKVGMWLTPFFMALSVLMCTLKRPWRHVDLIDAHYYYPDGVAVALVAMVLDRPFTVTARGTDINLIAQFFVPRRLILWTANRARASICVCRALQEKLQQIGADEDKILVLRNGVDLNFFTPKNRDECRQSWGVVSRCLLSVGLLSESKGHHRIIAALARLSSEKHSAVDLSSVELLIVGSGAQREKFERLAETLGVAERVRFLGQRSQRELRELYCACDLLVLASSREGWANVLLEAMACGTSVVATRIGGTPEVVTAPAAGLLVEAESDTALTEGIKQRLQRPVDRVSTRLYAEKFSWDETVEGLLDLYRRLLPECRLSELKSAAQEPS